MRVGGEIITHGTNCRLIVVADAAAAAAAADGDDSDDDDDFKLHSK